MLKQLEPVRLQPEEFQELLSPYLTEGRAQERWRIADVAIAGDRLLATVEMVSTYVSPTDRGGFHLTIFSSLEFLSQLLIILGHHRIGQERKTREAWMIESTARLVRAIRDPARIEVEIELATLRRRGENWYCIADCVVRDGDDGRFEVQLKGFLS